MNPEDITAFLMRANMPHATGEAQTTAETDGSRTIQYTEGDFKMHDNFFGGEPYGGRLVIFYQNRPVFLEAYYGRVYNTSKSADEVYIFLRKALQHPTEDTPYRGPAEYTEGTLVYTCACEGDVTNHTVKEYIHDGETEIYSAIVVGGLVDLHSRGAM
jgi:hypothetical protein